MTFAHEADRWRTLKYVSARLAKLHLDSLAAAPSPRRIRGGSISTDVVPGVSPSIELSRGNLASIDMSSPSAVARATDHFLSGSYLNLAHPIRDRAIAGGRLIKAQLFVQPAFLRVTGRELLHPSINGYDVVAFSSIDFIEGIGRVFIGLVGSAHNLVSIPSSLDSQQGARYASDAQGLYEMIQYTKEQLDPDLDPRLLANPPRAYHETTEAERIRDVADAFRGYDLHAAPRPTEMLFEVHHVARDIDLGIGSRMNGAGHVDLAIVGAPIWIREAYERTYISVQDFFDGPGAMEDMWDSFDEELRTHIRDERYETQWTPSSDADWQQFGRWAAAWLGRLANEPQNLTWTPRRFSFWKYSWGEARDTPINANISGWAVTDWGALKHFVSAAGKVYPSFVRGGDVVYLYPIRPEPQTWNDPGIQDTIQDIYMSITGRLLPFAR